MKGKRKGGWIILWRSTQKTAVLESQEPACQRWAWVDLLLLAASNDYHDLGLGQVRASVRFMAQRWRWSKSKAERFRRRLIRARMVRPIREEVFEIVNWKAMQSFAATRDTNRDTNRDRKRDTEAKDQNWFQLDTGTPPGTPTETPTETKSTKQINTALQLTTAGRTRPAPSRQMAGPAGEVCRAFDVGHRATFSAPYLCVFARDQKALRDPLRLYGVGLVLEMVLAFWEERKKARQHPDDPRYAAGRAKPHIPGFVGQIPNLLSRYEFDAKPDPGGTPNA